MQRVRSQSAVQLRKSTQVPDMPGWLFYERGYVHDPDNVQGVSDWI